MTHRIINRSWGSYFRLYTIFGMAILHSSAYGLDVRDFVALAQQAWRDDCEPAPASITPQPANKIAQCAKLKQGLNLLRLSSNEELLKQFLSHTGISQNSFANSCDKGPQSDPGHTSELAKKVAMAMGGNLQTAPVVGPTGGISPRKRYENQTVLKVISCIEQNKASWIHDCQEFQKTAAYPDASFGVEVPLQCLTNGSSNSSRLPTGAIGTIGTVGTVGVTFSGPHCSIIHVTFPTALQDQGSSKAAYLSYDYNTWDEASILKFHEPYSVRSLDPEAETRLKNEITVLNAIKGQTFPGLPNVIHSDEQRFIMESFESDLTKTLNNSTTFLGPNAWIQAGSQLNFGLRILHAMGLVHSDIKLNNVMISNPNNADAVKAAYIDFDLAYSPWHLCQQHKNRPKGGTLFYYAPEQGDSAWHSDSDCKTSMQVAQKADVFAHAGMIYSLKYGKVPPMRTCLETYWKQLPNAPSNRKDQKLYHALLYRNDRSKYPNPPMFMTCLNDEITKLKRTGDRIDALLAQSFDPDPLKRPSIDEFQKKYDGIMKEKIKYHLTLNSAVTHLRTDLNEITAQETLPVSQLGYHYVTYVDTSSETGRYVIRLIARTGNKLISKTLHASPFDAASLKQELRTFEAEALYLVTPVKGETVANPDALKDLPANIPVVNIH